MLPECHQLRDSKLNCRVVESSPQNECYRMPKPKLDVSAAAERCRLQEERRGRSVWQERSSCSLQVPEDLMASRISMICGASFVKDIVSSFLCDVSKDLVEQLQYDSETVDPVVNHKRILAID